MIVEKERNLKNEGCIFIVDTDLQGKCRCYLTQLQIDTQ